MDTVRFPFAFSPTYRLPALAFGGGPSTAWAELDDHELRARFGLWSLCTPRSNIAGAQRSGGFSIVKAGGPARLSLSDRGVTFATNGDAAVCVRFHEPVKAIDPTGLIRHPGATLTVADPAAFLAALDLP